MGNQVIKEKVGCIRKAITVVGWKAVKNESAFQKEFPFYLSSYATVITFLRLPPVISFLYSLHKTEKISMYVI